MFAPHIALTGFPDDAAASDFILAYLAAVAPRDRRQLATRLPLFILPVPDPGAAGDGYKRHVGRVVEALEQPISHGGKRVPYAVLRADADAAAELLAEQAGEWLGGNIPSHMTPDDLPRFRLLRDVIKDVRGRGGVGGDLKVVARELRDTAYERRVQQPGLLRALWGIKAPSQIPWLESVWTPFTQGLPRWLWARRQTHRLIRPMALSPFRRPRWLGAEVGALQGQEDLFGAVYEWARDPARWLADRNHPERAKALQKVENLLVRALLDDLRRPSVGGLLPRRRRRTARPVLLVELPPEREPGAARAERFLRALYDANEAVPAPGPLVIAVGCPSATLLEYLGGPEAGRLRHARDQLSQTDGRGDGKTVRSVLVSFDDGAFDRPGPPPATPVRPKKYRTGWLTMTSLVSCLALLGFVAVGKVAYDRIRPQASECVGGDDSVAASALSEPVQLRPEEWYDAAHEEIERQNARAENFAAKGRTVRTVVLFGSSKPTDETATLFDGTIPELRGVALWQKKLNDEAVSDDRRVPLRVEIRTTGKAFKDAEREAQKLVEEIRTDPTRTGSREIIGVLGYAQSRDETRAALEVLGKARIPAIGTTATADEMLDSTTYKTYWPFTPTNSTEARIEADFASGSAIVAAQDSQGGCTTAGHAIVIESSADLYSNSLAQKFRKDFPGTTQVFDFAQDGTFGVQADGSRTFSAAYDLAEAVCEEVEQQPESVVYWSARARDFTAFINALNDKSTCLERDLTVLGGNELTNVAQTGAFDDKNWLRLYYSSHRMPVTDPRASDTTKDFVAAYDTFVTETTEGRDPWRQDGHSAVSYDALRVLSRAADMTYRTNSVDTDSMLIALGGGISFDGATGYVAYGQGSNAAPADKTLVLLRQTAEGPVAVAACGAYAQDQSSAQQGPPCAP